MVQRVDKPVDPKAEPDGGVMERRKRRRKPPNGQQGGGAVYGLGLIGALVWYWRQAEEPSDFVVGVLKALVWPAFLVYKAFEVLQSLASASGNNSG
jgi:hypothetical protein